MNLVLNLRLQPIFSQQQPTFGDFWSAAAYFSVNCALYLDEIGRVVPHGRSSAAAGSLCLLCSSSNGCCTSGRKFRLDRAGLAVG